MSDYIEIENPKEIRRLNRVLSVKLRDTLRYSETRTIGYPRGNFQAKVRFLRDVGTDVLYWHGSLSGQKRKARNFFGHGTPGAAESLNIDVQFNVPVVVFSRASGGAFLRHLPTGRVVLAHRGIVTLGHGRVPKATLFSEMAATVREADTGSATSEFLLIGELESPTIINDLDEFSSELRRAVRGISAHRMRAKGDEPEIPSNASGTLSGRLRHYFDEFSGKRQLKGRGKSVADCYHGTVVRAIRDALDDATETLKSQAIDLTAIVGKRIYLFEVKTSAKPQSIYTAVGQLTAHAPIVAEYAPRRTLVRVIVLPDRPNKRLCRVLEDQLGIRLLTFTRSAQGRITIDSLEQLKS